MSVLYERKINIHKAIFLLISKIMIPTKIYSSIFY